jgi:hypothetical protein
MELSEGVVILDNAARILKDFTEGKGKVKAIYEDTECRIIREGEVQVAIYRNGEIFVRGEGGKREGKRVRRTFRDEYENVMVKKSPFYTKDESGVTSPAGESRTQSPRRMNAMWLFGTKEEMEATHGLDTLMSTLKEKEIMKNL